ncbi:MAG: hypothetical protein EOP85_06460 [Verrucomicrobiaceae bacterium]|nr:MAG: hypothetical protein EOP85_06460 [Verrucomicrobiaceae bacterium]
MLLHLSHLTPIASGQMRLVFRHPGDPNLLVKVIRPDVIDARWGSGLKWYKSNRRFRQYISFVREIEEYIAVYTSHGCSVPFLQKVVGLVDTDYGLGLIVEAAVDSEGRLAPTLWKMVLEKNLHDEARAALELFFEQVLASSVVVADMHPGNLVYVETPGEPGHFVMIDGLGVSNIIPFKVISSRINRRSKVRRIERLRQRIATRLAAEGPQKGD